MAITVTLVHQGSNHLRYLATGTGAVPNLTSTGAASPDLLTDTLIGPLKNIANAFANGYGQYAAGALTQAQARALWLSDDDAGKLGGLPRARVTVTKRSGDISNPIVDADVSAGHPIITVGGGSLGGVYSVYIDVEVGAIGD